MRRKKEEEEENYYKMGLRNKNTVLKRVKLQTNVPKEV